MIALISGGAVGLCLASFLTVLKLPQRARDLLDAGGMRSLGWALTLGAMLAGLALALPASLPMAGVWQNIPGVLATLIGGVFVGAVASALTEVLDVVPIMLDRLDITHDMRMPALALMLGKTLGALMAGVMEI